jgi:hypothetical protein
MHGGALLRQPLAAGAAEGEHALAARGALAPHVERPHARAAAAAPAAASQVGR